MLKNWQKYLILVYEVLLIIFLLAELGVPVLEKFRATNQVIILSALLFLPFLIPTTVSMLKRLSLKLSGKELVFDFRELEINLEKIHQNLSGRMTSAEQILLPVVGGKDLSSQNRFRQNQFIIGAKEFPEQIILAHLIGRKIKSAIPNINYEIRAPNGGSLKNYADLSYGWIDAYIEYTGTGCLILNTDHRGKSNEDILEELNLQSRMRHGIAWLSPLGCSANYQVIIHKKTSEKYNILTLEDLSRHAGKLIFCADIEFFSRRDGYIGLADTYRLKFKHKELCGIDEHYEYVTQNKADVTIGYETDPELQDKKNFVSLKDTKNFFPDYLAVPLVRVEALEHFENLEESLNELEGRLENREITSLVAQYNYRGDDYAVAEDLAKNFLGL